MKENSTTRVVLVRGDSANHARRRARTLNSFTTVRFEDNKHRATAYGTFWFLLSRKFL